jgi:hypothetical protein
MAVTALGLCALSAATQPPPGGPDKGPPGGKKGPPRYELGKVLPPFVREALDLTPEQQRQVEELEKDVRAQLQQILTPQQRRQIEEIKGPPKKDGFEKGPPKKGKGDNKGPPGQALGPPATIQWYATLAGGLREAERTGKAILLVSAAPHCAGVSGIW